MVSARLTSGVNSTVQIDVPLATRLAPVRRTAAALGAVGALVSMAGSWIPSLWGDEAASMLSAQRSIPSLFAMITHVDAVHATYYLFLHFWTILAGTSPFALRLPSALIIGVCVAGIVLIGARLDSLTVGVIAGAICIVIPRVTSMGQEARSYAFSAAIAAWLTVILIGILQAKTPVRRRWLIYSLLTALAIYVFLYLVLIPIAHLALIVLRDDRRVLVAAWAKAFALSILIAVPLVVAGIIEHDQIAYLASRMETSFPTLAVGIWFGNNTFAVVAWALIFTAIALFVIDLRRGRARFLSPSGTAPSVTLVAAAWFFVPSVLLIGSQFLVPDFTARYLSMCAPAAALLMAVAVQRIARNRIPLIAIALLIIVALAAPNWLQQRGPYAKNNSDWAAISSKMATLVHAGDAVVFDESTRPSRSTRLAMNTYPAGFTGLKDVMLKTPFYNNTTWYDARYSLSEAAALGRFTGVSRVWLVEYAIGSKIDTYGVDELKSFGFVQGKTVKNYRSAIIEFMRP